MTPEEFLEHCNIAKNHKDKGRARLNRARKAYGLYVRAYKTVKLFDWCFLAKCHRPYEVIFQAAKDRDEGVPICFVEFPEQP